jgi:N-acetylneuraminic acid mutarotase
MMKTDLLAIAVTLTGGFFFSIGSPAGESTGEVTVEIQWTRKADLPAARRNLKAVSAAQKIYAAGGYAQPHRGPERGLFVYDIAGDRWEHKAQMLTGRSNFAFVAHGGRLYAIGGDPFLEKGEAYDPAADVWKAIQGMPTARQHLNGCSLQDRVYVIGGLRSREKVPAALSCSNEVYDPGVGKWTSLAALPSCRQNASLAGAGGGIFVIGGMTADDVVADVDVYAPDSDRWAAIADLPMAGFLSGATVIGDTLFVLDGVRKSEGFTRLFVYDTAVGKWSLATPLPIGLKLAGFTSWDDRLYVVGGCDESFVASAAVFEGRLVKK